MATLTKHHHHHHHHHDVSEKAPPPPPSSPPPYTSSRHPIRFPVEMRFEEKYTSSTSHFFATKGEPLFAVRTPSRINCFGNKKHVLHAGPTRESPPLASVGPQKGSWGRRSVIRVAPSAAEPLSDERFLEIVMDGDARLKHPLTIPLDNGAHESFEWRNSRGHEVRNLSGGYNYGWKLVRLSGPPAVSGRVDKLGYTSDGKEVVAVAAYPRLFHRNPRFAFVGTGSTGELGQRFEVVAVLSFLRLYELAMQQMNAGSAASSASSASAAASV